MLRHSPKPTTPACSRSTPKASPWMRRTRRTSRCSSVSSARRTSTSVYAAAGQVLGRANVTAMKLEAFKYYYVPAGDRWPRGHLREADAWTAQAASGHHCRRRSIHGGNRRLHPRSSRTPDDPVIDAALIAYVSTFVPKMSGENFNPHVSTGVAPTDLPRPDAGRTVRAVHLFARGRGRLPARPVRHGGEETQGTGPEPSSRKAIDHEDETTSAVAGAFSVEGSR